MGDSSKDSARAERLFTAYITANLKPEGQTAAANASTFIYDPLNKSSPRITPYRIAQQNHHRLMVASECIRPKMGQTL